MVLKLDTNQRKIEECFEEFEQNLSFEQMQQVRLDTASMLILAMVKNAESSYKLKQIQKVYIDVLAAYAKRLIDPEGESENIDVSARISELREKEQFVEM